MSDLAVDIKNLSLYHSVGLAIIKRVCSLPLFYILKNNGDSISGFR